SLQLSAVELVRRHEALRTRIVVCNGTPAQDIAEPDDFELPVSDLSPLPNPLREIKIQRAIEQLILEPIDVAVGPLFGIRLLRLSQDEHVVIVAMEHIFSDGSSVSVRGGDLFSAYTQPIQGGAFFFPAIPIQFADYAVWQRKALESWFDVHGTFWNQ